jgi:hypothetical protein
LARKLLVGSIVFLVLGSALRAQNITGHLEGKIVTTADGPIAGATVVVSSSSLQGSRGTSSDERGLFRLLDLPPGFYSVRITHVSYRPLVVEHVLVQLGTTAALERLALEPQETEMPEVVVSAERFMLDPSSAAAGGSLLREEIEVLPIGRDYRSVAAILPLANESFFGDEVNIGGATGAENRYFVNGSDVTDTYSGNGGTTLPYNFIREIEVMSGGYEAEYRSSLGGIINVITSSGGNEFSGQAFGYFTNQNFAAEQRVSANEPPKGAFSEYDFGFSLGGPIAQDRLWFFAAYSPSYRNEEIALAGLGRHPDRFRAHTFAGKLTWKVTETVDLAATVLGDPGRQTGVTQTFAGPVLEMANPDPYLSDLSTGGYSVLLDGRHAPGENVLIEGSLALTTRREKNMSATQQGASEAMFYDSEREMLSGGYPERLDNVSTSMTLQCAGTVNFDRHTLKAGVAYRDIGLETNLAYSYVARSPDPVYGSTYFLLDILQAGTIRNRIPSLFVQDSWSLSDHFRCNIGLRWDGLFIIDSNGKVAQQILGQYQPRVGLIVLPGKDGRDKLFGTFGRYTEDLLMYGSTLYHIEGARQVGLMYTHDPRLDRSGADTLVYAQNTIQGNIQDLRGQYYDEFTAGYEHLFSDQFKVGLRGIYRVLREIIEDAEAPQGSGAFHYANPGHDPLGAYPRPRRECLALELTLEKSWGKQVKLLASYVLSRNYGNCAGLYYQEAGAAIPNAGPAYDFLNLMPNTTGLLPNDRTHVLKVHCSFRTEFGLLCGASLLWASGTPLSVYSAGPGFDLQHLGYLVPRGSAGRLPSIWDVNLRLSYDLPRWSETGPGARLVLDILHVGSKREVVQQDQLQFLDDARTMPNQAYGSPMKFQPPMAFRTGVEVSF